MGNGRRVPRQLAPERIRIAAIVLACASAVATAATRADDGAAPAPPPSSSTAAGGAAAQAPAPRAAERGRFIRRVEGDDGRVTLQVASRRYRDPAGGPTVTLVSAVHIGERGYYEAMQRLLDGHGAVLYESVTPRGAVTTRKAVADDPALATR
ncbi:MAG: hypothetical protein FJ253_07610, partial [Phycisphaerae bacterium]|nr:hypothetical protein [Phycisphaerae bacterium]